MDWIATAQSQVECAKAVEASKPLSIVMMATQKLWHGGEEQAALLAEGLRRRGHRCKILARRESAFAQGMNGRGFDVVPFAGRGRLPHATWSIRKQLSRWKPDIVYLNDPHAVTAFGLSALGRQRPPAIAARRVDFALKRPYRYQRFTDLLVCVSRAVQRACEQGGIATKQLRVVHDGVDPRRMADGTREKGRASLRLRPDHHLLLTVAKLTDHKGHRYMMQAMPHIVKKFPNAVWAIAGDGTLWDELQKQAIDLGVAEHVLMLGHRKDVPDLMAAADALVVPSHMEGLCSTIIDAMFCGLPVIASRAGGIPDLLDAAGDDSEVGWLVPPRDPQQLAKAVCDSLEFPNTTRVYAEHALARAQRCFSADEMVERTLSLFHEAIRIRRRQTPNDRAVAATPSHNQ